MLRVPERLVRAAITFLAAAAAALAAVAGLYWYDAELPISLYGVVALLAATAVGQNAADGLFRRPLSPAE